MPPLKNVRHEKFCQELASGTSQREAYKKAGFSERSVNSQSSEVASRPDVKTRLKELNELTFSANVMSIIERKERLTSIARNGNNYAAIGAIAELNKMEGTYPPARVETTCQSVAIKRIIVHPSYINAPEQALP
jgi:phage terminase small subunit